MELDHIFICTSIGAPEAEELIDFGLLEGSPNTHPGQGTSNRRFYFHNAYLELVWMHDIKEGKSSMTSPTKLYERCCEKGTNISPIGIGFRAEYVGEVEAPFNYWSYKPSYFPEHIEIQIGCDTPLSEPMWFFMSVKPTDRRLRRKRKVEPKNHNIPLETLTLVTIHINIQELSDFAKVIEQKENFKIVKSKESLIVLEFDNGALKKTKDFRPSLPLVINW